MWIIIYNNNLDTITNKNNKDDKKMVIQNVNNWVIWIKKN